VKQFNDLESSIRTTTAKLLKRLGVDYGFKSLVKKRRDGLKKTYKVMDITIDHLKEAIVKVKELPICRADKNGLVTYRESCDQYTIKTLRNLIKELENE